MSLSSQSARHFFQHPFAFFRETLRCFAKNQGLLLAGAVAYYALLSVVPLLILSVIGLSHWVDQAELLHTLRHYLEWLVPSQSEALLVDVTGFLENRVVIGLVLLATMLFFSSLTFSVLQKAMDIIFGHVGRARRKHSVAAAVFPYVFALLLVSALLALTVGSILLQSMASESVSLFHRQWSLAGPSGVLLYLLGLIVETLLLAAIYWILPSCRIRLRHALVGGFTAASLWEVVRHLLIWYFTRVSKASIVYGSLTTAVVSLFSMEIAATVLLLGAQVIAEYEKLGRPSIPGDKTCSP